MADQDDLVTIHLDEPRQYRDRESYIVKVIGPGNVKVPRETAKHWGITPVGAHTSTSDEGKTAAKDAPAKA